MRLVHAVAGILLIWTGLSLAQEPGALVRERCVTCHDLSRTCLVESADASWWSMTLTRMNEYQPELLTAEEIVAMSAVLVDPARRKTLCP